MAGLKRQAEAVALSLASPEGRDRVLRWAWDLPDEARDAVMHFWQEDRYFKYRPAPPTADERPAHWRADNGPWARRRR